MSWAITLALALIIVGIAGEVYAYFRSRYTKRIIEDCLKRRDCSRYLR
jgi:Tfp pilus assembly protein PilW